MKCRQNRSANTVMKCPKCNEFAGVWTCGEGINIYRAMNNDIDDSTE